MPRLTELRYLASLKSGKLQLPRERMAAELSELEDEEGVEVIIRREKRRKTYEQLKAFHGPICEQVQQHYMDTEGLFKSLDHVKEELKEAFLQKEPQFYDDGSPVMVKIKHPERKGVNYDWHMEKIPSLADLSIEQMNGFISAILEYFLHERGFDIVIESKD
jgi:hypothetical protein